MVCESNEKTGTVYITPNYFYFAHAEQELSAIDILFKLHVVRYFEGVQPI